MILPERSRDAHGCKACVRGNADWKSHSPLPAARNIREASSKAILSMVIAPFRESKEPRPWVSLWLARSPNLRSRNPQRKQGGAACYPRTETPLHRPTCSHGFFLRPQTLCRPLLPSPTVHNLNLRTCALRSRNPQRKQGGTACYLPALGRPTRPRWRVSGYPSADPACLRSALGNWQNARDDYTKSLRISAAKPRPGPAAVRPTCSFRIPRRRRRLFRCNRTDPQRRRGLGGAGIRLFSVGAVGICPPRRRSGDRARSQIHRWSGPADW